MIGLILCLNCSCKLEMYCLLIYYILLYSKVHIVVDTPLNQEHPTQAGPYNLQTISTQPKLERGSNLHFRAYTKYHTAEIAKKPANTTDA